MRLLPPCGGRNKEGVATSYATSEQRCIRQRPRPPAPPHPCPPPQEGAGALTPSILPKCSALESRFWVESKRDAQIGRLSSAPAGAGKRHAPRSNRSRAGRSERSRAISLSRAIYLDKIRNILYVLVLTESLPARRLPGSGEEKRRLFDNLPDHNRGVRAGEEEISLFFSPATP
jgi:hypothetical protein